MKFSWLCPVGCLSLADKARKTTILVLVFWNFKFKVLKYPRNSRLHATLILNLVKPLTYILLLIFFLFKQLLFIRKLCGACDQEGMKRTVFFESLWYQDQFITTKYTLGRIFFCSRISFSYFFDLMRFLNIF